MSKNKILTVIIIPLLSFKCVSNKMLEKFIEVNNQLSVNVYCLPAFEYPDTSLAFTNKEKILANDSIYYISSLATKKLFYIDLCKKETWQKITKADTIQVFVFDEKVLKERSWNDIVNNRIYLRRLVYSHNDIVHNGCKITVK